MLFYIMELKISLSLYSFSSSLIINPDCAYTMRSTIEKTVSVHASIKIESKQENCCCVRMVECG